MLRDIIFRIIILGILLLWLGRIFISECSLKMFSEFSSKETMELIDMVGYHSNWQDSHYKYSLLWISLAIQVLHDEYNLNILINEFQMKNNVYKEISRKVWALSCDMLSKHLQRSQWELKAWSKPIKVNIEVTTLAAVDFGSGLKHKQHCSGGVQLHAGLVPIWTHIKSVVF